MWQDAPAWVRPRSLQGPADQAAAIAALTVLNLKTAVGSMLKRLKPSIDAGLQPILATAEQFQIGARNNLAKLFSNRYMQPLCGVNCGF